MAKYRKKPVIVEAEQWFPDHPVDGVQFSKPPLSTGAPRWWMDTLEGWHEVTPSDWIITGVEGERYPCKDSIFQATYESVEQ